MGAGATVCHWALWQNHCHGLSVCQWVWGLSIDRRLSEEGALTDETAQKKKRENAEMIKRRAGAGKKGGGVWRAKDKLTKERMVCCSIIRGRVTNDLHKLWESFSNTSRPDESTNHDSVDGCQQCHELPFLFQTCGMCRGQYFNRVII